MKESLSCAFERHLREAIALNQQRAPHYAAVSGGASRSISRALIAAEWMLLPLARWFDRRAEVYHRAGIPLLEELFVSMAKVPAVGAYAFESRSVPPRTVPDAARIRKRVAKAYRERHFEGAAEMLGVELRQFAAGGATDSLVRHLLESARRLAQLAPANIALARDRGLASPEPLLARLFRLHLRGLAPASILDARAQPLQARGIRILADDLPPIPPWSEDLPVSATQQSLD